MSVNLPEAKKKESMLDTLSTGMSIASSVYNIKDKMGEKKPEETNAIARRTKAKQDEMLG